MSWEVALPFKLANCFNLGLYIGRFWKSLKKRTSKTISFMALVSRAPPSKLKALLMAAQGTPLGDRELSRENIPVCPARGAILVTCHEASPYIVSSVLRLTRSAQRLLGTLVRTCATIEKLIRPH